MLERLRSTTGVRRPGDVHAKPRGGWGGEFLSDRGGVSGASLGIVGESAAAARRSIDGGFGGDKGRPTSSSASSSGEK